ncbi:hypothetical protein [Desulfonema magnum]|uniref:LysM domain-containing protein n=1 Tax=Desulfonema magnum TaxID=45655 RepID=A0A975GQR7_9BACT|nr:hypothetical protein [Desulfonema magnum]QTA89233.1 LysM domain-containing protein [Desulfonema magnum]
MTTEGLNFDTRKEEQFEPVPPEHWQSDRSDELTCPVCGLENISSDNAQCPQCDSDLNCFKVLDSLPDELPPEKPVSDSDQDIPRMQVKEKSRGMKIVTLSVIVLLMILMIVMIAFLFYQFRELETQNARLAAQSLKLEKETTELRVQGKKLENQSLKLEKLEAQLQARNAVRHPLSETKPPEIMPSNPMEAASVSNSDLFPAQIGDWEAVRLFQLSDSDFRLYSATDKDTLWDISEQHYGEGYYYPVLLEHNSHLGIYSVRKGVRLKILKNTDLLRDIYNSIIVRKGNKIYWNYTIMEGDTLESVVMKFYTTEEVKNQLSVSDAAVQLKPGRKIRILLK